MEEGIIEHQAAYLLYEEHETKRIVPEEYQKPHPLSHTSQEMKRPIQSSRLYYTKEIRLLLGCYLVSRVYRYYCPNKTLGSNSLLEYYDTAYEGNGCIHFVQNKEALDGPSRMLK